MKPFKPLALALIALLVPLVAPAADAPRVVAVGDVHGEIGGFTEVLRAAGVLGEDGRWAGGDTVLVQTGDLTDRGSQVRQVLDLMMALDEQAPAQGGRVVSLLGNHEIYNLSIFFDTDSTPVEVYHQIWSAFADEESERRRRQAFRQWLRWLRNYRQCGTSSRSTWMAQRPLGYLEYVEAMSPKGRYGSWLRSRPVVANVDGTIFLHGGLSPKLLKNGISSIDEINARARQELEQFDRDRAQLIADGVIPPFANLGEIYCALQKDLVRLEDARGSSALRREELQALRDRLPGTPERLLFDPEGPVWFRGMASYTKGEDEKKLQKILTAFGGERVVVGHTPSPGKIQALLDGRIFLIDTAMAYGAKYGGRPAALELDGDSAVAIYVDRRERLTGENAPAEAPSGEAEPAAPPAEGGARPAAVERAPFVGPDGVPGHASQPPVRVVDEESPPDEGGRAGDRPVWLDVDGQPLPFQQDGEIVAFLSQAEVVEREDVGSGVTQPELLLLRRGDVRARAIFHDIHVERDRQRFTGGKTVMFFRDSYINNVAAYELSRLLWIHNVPPAVVRTLDGQKGSVQLWVESASTEADRRARDFVPPGNWRLAWDDMWVFDNLINNIDRNQGNILYDSSWKLVLIDHTRAFGRIKKLPDPDRVRRVSRRLWRRMQEVGDERLNSALDPFLGVYELRALTARRIKLLQLIRQRINDQGEAEVLRSYAEAARGDEPAPDLPPAPAG